MGYKNEFESIVGAAKDLAALFEGSLLYKDYLKYKQALELDPDLLERVKAYKKISMDLELKRLRDNGVSFDEERRIAYQHSELKLHQAAGDFLSCEQKLLDLYKQVMVLISDACEMDF